MPGKNFSTGKLVIFFEEVYANSVNIDETVDKEPWFALGDPNWLSI